MDLIRIRTYAGQGEDPPLQMRYKSAAKNAALFNQHSVAIKQNIDYNEPGMNPRILARYVLRETMGLLVLAVALFVSAGRINWWPAWAALAVMVAWVVATAYVIMRFNPDLFAERLGPRKGAKSWDTAILSVIGIVQLARYIVAGLDQRNGWSGNFPPALQIAALILCVPGYALVVWATASNAFFSQIVRIQPERGHSTATGGPYRYMRHPAYLGAVLYELAVLVLLGSWWALLISSVNAAMLTLRTLLEDRTLQAELPGYIDFARKVRYRLIPGVW
jgi:protein-S-isoprenylcysteine O-methyltransferase Ste14